MTSGAPTSLAYPIVEHTLDNGLRVISSPDHGAPSVAVNLWYDVGSRDEEPGRTGFAHLFEHVMFQGSAHVASGQHIALLQAAGASVNATTWFDRTNYFETLPTGGLDLALWLEADRLGTLLDALTQESLDNQREVVKEEKRQRYDNVPYGDAMELLNALTFPRRPPVRAHHDRLDGRPERRHPGRRAARSSAPTTCPNNAVLSIVGDVDPDDAFAQRPSLLRPPGRRRADRRGPTAEPLPPLTGTERRRDLGRRAGRRGLSVLAAAGPGHRGVRRPRPGRSSVLGHGQTSRLHKQLVRGTELAESASATQHGADRRQLVRLRVRPGPRRRRARAAGGRAGGRGRAARSTTARPSWSCGGPRPSTSGTGCTSWPGSTPAPTRWASTPPCTATRT